MAGTPYLLDLLREEGDLQKSRMDLPRVEHIGLFDDRPSIEPNGEGGEQKNQWIKNLATLELTDFNALCPLYRKTEQKYISTFFKLRCLALCA